MDIKIISGLKELNESELQGHKNKPQSFLDSIKIKKAMKMRGLTPSLKGFLKAPAINIECVYVPLMMSGARRADELSAAAISRGIENPAKRTSYQLIGFKTADVVCIIIAILLLLYTWRGL